MADENNVKTPSKPLLQNQIMIRIQHVQIPGWLWRSGVVSTDNFN